MEGQNVRIWLNHSIVGEIENGVPKGSGLDPILSMIYVILLFDGRSSEFVDYTALLYENANENEEFENLNDDIKLLNCLF